MNRLQKKCLIATAGFHLLLIVILIVGPGFFRPRDTVDTSQMLDLVSDATITAALDSGVKDAKPPAPAPPMVDPPKPIPTPPPPQPQPTPQPPQPTPQPVKPDESVVEKFKDFFKPTPVAPAPDPDTSTKVVEHKPKPPEKHKINVDMSDFHRTTVQNNTTPRHNTDAAQQRAARARAEAYNNAINSLEKNFTPSTKVEMPGTGSVSYASYASIIRTKYTQAWVPPSNAANDLANVRVSITVSSDGTVESAHIIEPSGDSGVDESVQQTLDRVTFIAPFPDGATEKEKTFIINFNLKAKRMLG